MIERLRLGPPGRARAVLAATAVGIAALAPAGTATAAPNAKASCMGHEAEAISPPGSSDEFEDGMPGLGRAIRDSSDAPPGRTYSPFARAKHGSHEACDEAFEG
jgi:hypothetical protein